MENNIKQFYEYETDEERVSNVYSKFTINDFWTWWSNNQEKTMEVRIRDYNLIKETASKLNLPWSPSGIYTSNANQLKLILKEVRDKTVLWMGISPRKKNWCKNGYKGFAGTDHHVEEIAFLFIDIDRVSKNKTFATCEDLMHCNKLAELLLEKLGTEGWNKNYIKICSGNGVQMLIRLDIPIKIPSTTFDNETKTYMDTEEFTKIKMLVREGIGAQMLSFSKKFSEELNVFVDPSVFKLSVVGALPFSKNFKYAGVRWRGLIELKNEGENVGLSDYILQYLDNIKTFKEKNPFGGHKSINLGYRIKEGQLEKDPLVRFMLENEFSEGGINNTIWFSLKCLIRDSSYKLDSEEFRKFHETIKRKHSRSFTLNIPEQKFIFDVNAINNYCIQFGYKPVYELWPKKTKFLNLIDMSLIKWENINSVTKSLQLPEKSTILDDLTTLKNLLEPKSYKNIEIVLMFLKGTIAKYSETKAKYYFENIYDKFLNYE